MPLMKVQINGKIGWRVGTNGKVFFGKNARQRALDHAKSMTENHNGC